MTFIWPWMLVSLLLLPLFIWLYVRTHRRRRRALAHLGSLGSTQAPRGYPGDHPAYRRRHLSAAISFFGVALLLIAVARPHMPLSAPRIEGVVILAFDVSASMAADDLESIGTGPRGPQRVPDVHANRMEAAKTSALAFVQEKPDTIRVGLVTFSGGGMVVQPPTVEQIEMLDAINRLAPQSGTSLGEGILAALGLILTGAAPQTGPDGSEAESTFTPIPTPLPSGSFDDAVIVLFTDGEDMADSDPLGAAERAADYGVRVYTVGMGSASGATIEIDGFTVITRLDEALLRRIAEITNGVYYNVESQEELTDIYDNVARALTIEPEETEVTALFAGAGMFALLLASVLSLLWFSQLP